MCKTQLNISFPNGHISFASTHETIFPLSTKVRDRSGDAEMGGTEMWFGPRLLMDSLGGGGEGKRNQGVLLDFEFEQMVVPFNRSRSRFKEDSRILFWTN